MAMINQSNGEVSSRKHTHIKEEIKDEAEETTEYVYSYDDATAEDDDAVSYVDEEVEDELAEAAEEDRLAKIKYRKKMIHGTNPQFLIEKILRERIYESIYWREHCFGLNGSFLHSIMHHMLLKKRN